MHYIWWLYAGKDYEQRVCNSEFTEIEILNSQHGWTTRAEHTRTAAARGSRGERVMFAQSAGRRRDTAASDYYVINFKDRVTLRLI